jgi:hypothetical protein
MTSAESTHELNPGIPRDAFEVYIPSNPCPYHPYHPNFARTDDASPYGLMVDPEGVIRCSYNNFSNRRTCRHGKDLKIWLAQEKAALPETASRSMKTESGVILEACARIASRNRKKRQVGSRRTDGPLSLERVA